MVTAIAAMACPGKSYGQSAKSIEQAEIVIIDNHFTTAIVNDKVMVKGYQDRQIPILSDLIGQMPEKFTPNKDNAHVVIGRAYEYPGAWIYLPIVNGTGISKKMVVDTDHNRCDTLEAYLLHGRNRRPEYLGKLYRNIPLADRAIPLLAYALPFTLPAKDSVILLLHSKRATGIHELNIAISTDKHFVIKNNEEELIRLFALSSASFFVFAILSLGLIFKHTLLVRFGIYVISITIGQLNFNFFFDQITFPIVFGLNANTIGIFIIFASNSFFHLFASAYIVSLHLWRSWHRLVIYGLVAASIVSMIILLFPLTSVTNQIITDASLIITTLNIFWLFYISVLGFVKKRDKYLFITACLVFVPILFKSYTSPTPGLNMSYFQPFYYLILFGYLIISLFRKELTSRQLTEQKIKLVHDELELVRKNEIALIGRNLHDQLGNTLASALGYLNMNTPNVSVSKTLILDAINETRVISHNLVKNDDRPLDEKLEDIVERFNDFSVISFEFKDFSEGMLNKLTSLKQQNIYMIVQEILNNIIKHSQAQEAIVQAFLIDGLIHVSIEDDGTGHNTSQQKDGIGIQNMYKRAELANLKLTIDTGSGGTLVTIETPLDS